MVSCQQPNSWLQGTCASVLKEEFRGYSHKIWNICKKPRHLAACLMKVTSHMQWQTTTNQGRLRMAFWNDKVL